jgi:hypothetical protein
LEAIDRADVATLALLDLLTAFDTSTRIFEFVAFKRHGINGKALWWF